MKRAELVNYIFGVWPTLIACYIFKATALSGVPLYPFFASVGGWQHFLGCLLMGMLGTLPQVVFNWGQSGHTWKNDTSEIKRAFIGAMVTALALVFVENLPAWIWMLGVILFVADLLLWDARKVWKAITSIFKKKK